MLASLATTGICTVDAGSDEVGAALLGWSADDSQLDCQSFAGRYSIANGSAGNQRHRALPTWLCLAERGPQHLRAQPFLPCLFHGPIKLGSPPIGTQKAHREAPRQSCRHSGGEGRRGPIERASAPHHPAATAMQQQKPEPLNGHPKYQKARPAASLGRQYVLRMLSEQLQGGRNAPGPLPRPTLSSRDPRS